MMVGAQVVLVCNISSQIYCAAYFLVSISIIFWVWICACVPPVRLAGWAGSIGWASQLAWPLTPESAQPGQPTFPWFTHGSIPFVGLWFCSSCTLPVLMYIFCLIYAERCYPSTFCSARSRHSRIWLQQLPREFNFPPSIYIRSSRCMCS
jgi:hypothetical protein